MAELVIRGQAQQQILDTYAYYEDLKEGLGDRFEQELDGILDRIEQNPKFFQAEDRVFRRAHLKRFPYTVYFRSRFEDIHCLCMASGKSRGRLA